MTGDLNQTGLTERSGLPDALRVLVDEYPRAGWETHPRFSDLIGFWMERHVMFRRLQALLQQDARDMIERRMAPDIYALRLARFGSMLVHGLHEHHTIEDFHFFPPLSAAEPRLARGFDMLERDHHELMEGIAEFGSFARTAGRGFDEAALREHVSGLLPVLEGFSTILARHLDDEEDLVVPVLLSRQVALPF